MRTPQFKLLALALVSAPCIAGIGKTLAFYDRTEVSTQGTALIRPATKDEKQEKHSSALRFLVNPMGGGSTARILSIQHAYGLSAGPATPLKKNTSVRVLPGNYELSVSCAAPGFVLYFSVPVQAVADREYLLECTGLTAHQTQISLRELDPVQAQAPPTDTSKQRN